VAAERTLIDRAVGVAVERHAHVLEFVDDLRRLPAHDLDRGLVAEPVAKAPSAFTLTPRNPAHRVGIGEDHLVFGLVAGPPNIHDLEPGRRPGNYRDYCDFIRLAQ
jgi:trimethylamine:corrinoid methyltransferase-like protein